MSEKVEIIPEREDDWYMDPVSGNVQTLEKWREEQGLDELSGWCNEDMSIFVPVIKDKYGDWVNLEPDSVVAANRVIPAAAIADLKQMQGNERAEKILDMLQHSSVVPEDLPEFAVSRDCTKAFSGKVAYSVDLNWEKKNSTVVVSPNGQFVVLNENEAQGLNDDDEVKLSRKSINEDFTVTLNKDREQDLGR